MNRRLPILLTATLTGCFYPADRGRMIEQRIERLADSSKKLETQLKDNDAKQAEMIAQVQKALDSLDKAAHRSDADIGVQLQKTVEDVAALRGQVETYQYRVGELDAALKAAKE